MSELAVELEKRKVDGGCISTLQTKIPEAQYVFKKLNTEGAQFVEPNFQGLQQLQEK